VINPLIAPKYTVFCIEKNKKWQKLPYKMADFSSYAKAINQFPFDRYPKN